MEFLKRSIKRTKSGRKHPPPPSGSWFRKRAATSDNPKRGKLTEIIPTSVTAKNSDSIQIIKAQIHKPVDEPSLQDSEVQMNKKIRTRSKSLTYSENDAVGTLDEVLMNFDDNLNEIAPNDTEQVENIGIAKELGSTEQSGASVSQTTSTNIPKSHGAAVIMHEPIYSKPVKTENTKRGKENQPPTVPPKKFDTNEHEIKFSDLKKTPSTYQSLEKTDWANAKIQKSNYVRKIKKDSNNGSGNYSLKRGELSQSIQITTSEQYSEPPRDYEATDVVTLTEKASVSAMKDTWSTGSIASSSLSSSPRVKKPLRPEVLEMIRDKKVEPSRGNDPRLDGLVKRSFRLIRKSSLTEVLNQPSEEEYGSVMKETEQWISRKESLRASTKLVDSQTSASNAEKNTITNESKGENVLGDQSENVAVDTVTVATTETRKDATLTETKKGESPVTIGKIPSNDESSNVVPNAETSKDDEDLIRLMESNSPAEDESSDSPSNQVEFSNTPYVPRAVRMNFSGNWDGIRKDRRAWKSREMHHAASKTARNNSKKLSNRYDEQNVAMEMLF